MTPTKPLSGKRTWNLKRHIQVSHKDVYVTFFNSEGRLKLLTKRMKMLQNFCEIVTINGRPFASLLDSGFQKLIEDDMHELEEAGCAITLNDKFVEIKQYTKHVADEIKNTIIKKVENRFVSVLFDIASKNNRSVIGISVQFYNNGDIESHSLGIYVLDDSHTADYIKKVVDDCLKSFNISAKFVISMTTDNASAMIAMIKQFDEDIQASITLINRNDNEMNMNIPNFDANISLTEDQMDTIMQSVQEIEALNQVLDDDDTFEELYEKVIGEISKNTTLVTTIRCGAHSVQLIVRNGIKKSNFNKLLPLCKYVSRKLRTDKFKITARKKNIHYSIPKISVETRWDSDFLMVSGNYK